MSSNDPSQLNSDEAEFEQALIEVEQAFVSIKDRFAKIRQHHQQQAERQQRLQQLEQELQQTQDDLKELEFALESSLLSDREQFNLLLRLYWQGLRRGFFRDIFWQIVRFGRLGVVIGWFLKSAAGGSGH